ncbi:hypothetical protein GWC95_03035 [Sediminibacterium roseum]|uniref:Uncharacterized protein n=1 Tax=Sediminibacterium roseum TaxID=1978412 RepID=A0ABW9ZP69_9BACT|nr:hypothetical protein [Sediminibacterium roseum]NCI48881.1 hypothetical protein [Sediminibacterium roseum]
MNDTFSFSRFGLLLKKFIKEHSTTYLLYIAILAGLLFVLYGFTVLACLNSRFPEEAPVIFFIIGILFMGGLFASTFYSFFNNKAKGIQYLNLPSSHTEKLMIGFLFTQIVFFVVYFIVFFLVDHVMVAAYNKFHKMPANVSPEYIAFYTAKPVDFTNPEILNGITISFIVTAISHYGSLCFEKNAFVKTALLTIIGGVAYMFYSYYGMRTLVPDDVMPGGDNLFNTSLRVGNDETVKGIVHLPAAWTSFLTWFVPGMFYVLFWMGSYFRLKEKQV